MAVPVDLFPRSSSVFTDYCTAEGQVIYKVEAHSRWNGKTVNIRKVVSGTETSEGIFALKDEFQEVGRLEFSRFSENTISLQGENGQLRSAKKVSDVFERRGWPKIESLMFTGPDENAYEWRTSPFQVKLYAGNDDEDESDAIVIYPHLGTSSHRFPLLVFRLR